MTRFRAHILTFLLAVLFSSCASRQIALPPKPKQLPTGRGTDSGISRVVRANFDDIKTCYQFARKKDPKLAGTVVVEFSVEPGKPPKPIKIHESTLQNKDLDQCILSQFRKWDFPEDKAVKSEVVLTYPIELKP